MTCSCSYRTGLTVVFALFFVLSACDSGGDNVEINNEFSFDVTTSPSPQATAKAVSDTTITGFSFFYAAENPKTGEDVFTIYMSGNESFSQQSVQDGLFGFLARESSRPETGPYDLVPLAQGIDSDDFIGILFQQLGSDGYQDKPFYVPEGGTVSFTKSSSDRVAGSVDLTANALSFEFSGTTATVDTTVVQISGEFSARHVEQFVELTTPSNN